MVYEAFASDCKRNRKEKKGCEKDEKGGKSSGRAMGRLRASSRARGQQGD